MCDRDLDIYSHTPFRAQAGVRHVFREPFVASRQSSWAVSCSFSACSYCWNDTEVQAEDPPLDLTSNDFSGRSASIFYLIASLFDHTLQDSSMNLLEKDFSDFESKILKPGVNPLRIVPPSSRLPSSPTTPQTPVRLGTQNSRIHELMVIDLIVRLEALGTTGLPLRPIKTGMVI